MTSVATGIQDSQGAEGIQRDEQYWFPSGDIVLVADHKIAFKISIGLLCWKASVFRDLVNRDVPQPPDQETMDGCPVIHLTDEPEELKIFLDLMYDGWRFRKENKFRKWPIVKVMIVLGRKYDVPELYNEGIEMFSLTFPRNVADIQGPEERIEFTDEDIISAVNVTETLDPDLHAVALYLCCSLPLKTLAAGLLNEGTGLSPAVLHRCLRARESVVQLVLSHLFSSVSFPPTHYSHNCRSGAIISLWDLISQHSTSFADPHIAVIDIRDQERWGSLLALINSNQRICQTCKDGFTSQLLEMRQDFRDGLKERFGLQAPAVAATDEV